MTISDFISRCDYYCKEAAVTRVWLSKRLFSDTFRLDDLANGKSDVGVRRLERALSDLTVLEAANGSNREEAALRAHETA